MTRVSRRYTPATSITAPPTNIPIPPGVPPAPRTSISDMVSILAKVEPMADDRLFRPRDAFELLEPNENIPRLRPIRRPEDPRFQQLVDQPRRSAVADLQAPLKQRCRPTLI